MIEIAGHEAAFDAGGRLLPWASWNRTLDLELAYYQTCPVERGYPRFVFATFLDAAWNPDPNRTDSIPATQNGMGILSYLKFRALRGGREPRLLATARAMGNYLVKETLTPDEGRYPAFTRSTGQRDQYPFAADAGSQADRPYEIEPDKGGIAGHALLELFHATGEPGYLDQALHNARVLAANQQQGDSRSSPWPFRVDYRDGQPRGAVSGNMTYILRLFDGLIALGLAEFAAPRESLWSWMKRHQIPSVDKGGVLFAQFFEDHDTPTNRSAWAPLNLARYLLERRGALDPDWRADAWSLVEFVRLTFTHQQSGVTVCHEQDEDRQPWGGINATYGAVLALLARATGSVRLAAEAREALNFTLYSVDEQGRPRDVHTNPHAGGWQEDAHTDVLHNYVDALRAYPEWGAMEDNGA